MAPRRNGRGAVGGRQGVGAELGRQEGGPPDGHAVGGRAVTVGRPSLLDEARMPLPDDLRAAFDEAVTGSPFYLVAGRVGVLDLWPR